MKSIGILSTTGIVIVCAALGFFAGHTGRTHSAEAISRPDRAIGAMNKKSRTTTAESIDLQNILIQRVASVGFSELYDLMESAAPELREEWFDKIQRLPEGLKRSAALTTFFKVLVQLDPMAATRFMLRAGSTDDQLAIVKVVVGATHPTAMGLVAEALLKLPPGNLIVSARRDYLGDVIHEWSWSDPAAVGRFLEQHKDQDLGRYVYNFMESWAQGDPIAAKEWLDRNEVYQSEEGTRAWLGGWYEYDRGAALNFLVAHADTDSAVKGALEGITFALYEDNPEAARNFVSRLPTPETKQKAVDMLAFSASDQNVSPTGLHKGPAEIAEWLVSLPPDAWNHEIGSVLNQWSSDDAAGMESWLNQLPSETHDPVVAQFCIGPVSDLDDHRLSVALTIYDSQLREEVLRTVLKAGVERYSREGALEKINESSLPPSAKSQLLQLLPKE